MQNVEELRSQLMQAAKKGAAFISKHQNKSGALVGETEELGTYFKTPYALTASGHRYAASRLLTWIRENALDSSGNFSGPGGRGVHENNATYSNAWIIIGSQLMGFYDINKRALSYLKTMQHEESGFFYRTFPGAGAKEDAQTSSQSDLYSVTNSGASTDLLNTSMGGLACLATGLTSLAVRAGDSVVKMFDLQEDIPNKFYFQYDISEASLIRENNFAAAIDASKKEQKYFQLGIAAAFLAKLSMRTGDRGYLAYAKKYLDLTDDLAGDRFSIPMSGKIGWGASYVYHLTQDKKYAAIAAEVGRSLVLLQSESGSWKNDAPLGKQIEVTSEFVMILDEISAFL